MKKKKAAVFGVKKGEVISIKVTPDGVGHHVGVGYDKGPLANKSESDRHLLYSFTVTKKVHVVELIAQFMGSESEDAEYAIEISADDGKSFKMTPIVNPSTEEPSEEKREWRFEPLVTDGKAANK